MKTKIKLLLVLTTSIICTMNLSAQQIQCNWSNHSNLGYSFALSVASGQGNTSYTGGICRTIVLGSDTIHNGNDAGFTAKYDSLGNFVWAKFFESSDICHVKSVSTDKDTNVFTVLEFRGSISIGSNTFTAPNIPYNSDFLLTKHSSNGSLQFVKHFHSQGNIEALLVQTDINENAIVLWKSIDTTFVDNMSVSSNGWYFIAKIHNSGNILWIKSLNKNIGVLYGRESMAVDFNNDLLLTGNYFDTLSWGNSQLINTNPIVKGFIGKLNSSGNELWAKQVGSGYIQGEQIISDENGNIYNCGVGNGMQYFSNTDSTNLTSSCFFITHYDQDGNYKDYLRFASYCNMRSLAFRDNKLYVSGQNWVKYRPIIYSLDTSLNLIDSAEFSTYNAVSQSTDIDSDGNILMGGGFHNYLNIGSCLMSVNGSGYFIAKFKFTNNVNVNIPTSNEEISFYPNPANTYLNIEASLQSLDDFRVNIYDCNGRLVHTQILDSKTDRINIRNFKSGIYFIRLNDGKNVLSKKFI